MDSLSSGSLFNYALTERENRFICALNYAIIWTEQEGYRR